MSVQAYPDDWGRVCLQRACGGFWMPVDELTPSDAERLGWDLISLAAAVYET